MLGCYNNSKPYCSHSLKECKLFDQKPTFFKLLFLLFFVIKGNSMLYGCYYSSVMLMSGFMFLHGFVLLWTCLYVALVNLRSIYYFVVMSLHINNFLF